MFVLEPPHGDLRDLCARTIADSLDSVRGSTEFLGSLLLFVSSDLFRHYEEQLSDWGRIRQWFDQRYPGVPMVVGVCACEFAMDQSGGARANSMSLWRGAFSTSLPRVR